MTPPDAFSRYLELLERKAPRPLSIDDMVRALAIDDYDRRTLKKALEEQVSQKRLRRIGKTRYQWLRDVDRPTPKTTGSSSLHQPRRTKQRGSSQRIEGRFIRTRSGFSFVEPLTRRGEQFSRDILIPLGLEKGALHGDRVEVEITRRDPRTRRWVGQVVAVTVAVHSEIVGTLASDRRGWVLLPENSLLPPIRLLGSTRPEPAQEGLVARVRLTRAGSEHQEPGGELDAVLGAVDDPEVQFIIITTEYGLRVDFPDEVVAEAKRFPADPAEPTDYERRDDLRHLHFVTIDGETARDFDDAVCLESLPTGGSRLWVAIADVAHYISPGSALDLEALRRGNSVYFPDRAIPMLPHELSAGLCSLMPQRDRLVQYAEMEYDPSGRRRSARFGRGVIRSRARLTYTEVAAHLAAATSESSAEEMWRAQLNPMAALMRQLLTHRVGDGALDLDLPEAVVELSPEGRCIGIGVVDRNDAHRLIEEFMLEANRAVATRLRDKGYALPYRVHEPPDPDDIDTLNGFLHAFGFAVEHEQVVRPADVQRLLRQLARHPLSRVLSRHILRALAKAKYSTSNAGHFGLAFPIYCHFTSPIRRYPDLLVHRQLTRLLHGEAAEEEETAVIEAACVQSSQCERQAMEAERAMTDLKKCEFMQGHLQEPHEGTIVSVTKFGFFVELDAYPVEGLVRVADLPDAYTFIEAEQMLKGSRKRNRFRVGGRVRVKPIEVSLRTRQITLGLIEDENAAEVPIRPEHRRGKPPKRVGKLRRGKNKKEKQR